MKVKCIGYKRIERLFTIGKIYDLVDGEITNDKGFTYIHPNRRTNDHMLSFLSYWYEFEEVYEDKATIIIYRNDNTVTALNKDTKEKGIAKCSPSDTFDLYKGSRLALDRLFGKEIKKEEKSEFLTKFEKGKRYRFDLPQYLKQRNKKDISTNGWEKECIGKEVIIDTKETGAIDGYGIHCKWCVEIPVAEPVKETFYNGKVVCTKAEPYSTFTVGKAYQFIDGSVTDDNGHKFPKVNDLEQWQRGSKSHTEWMEVKEEQEQKPAEKYYNGRVMCLDPSSGNRNLYTEGKIYQFLDGYIVYDDGQYSTKRYFSFDAFKSYSSAKWLEIKE